MHKYILFAASYGLILGGGLACAQKQSGGGHQPSVVVPPSLIGMSVVSMMHATPSTIPFTANNPGNEIVSGSAATITWSLTPGGTGRSWNLSAVAMSSKFSGCITVPATAVALKCVSASVTGGGLASASCSVASFTHISNSLPGLRVAGGTEGSATAHNYTVVLSYELLDSWRYTANTCPLNVSYTVDAQ